MSTPAPALLSTTNDLPLSAKVKQTVRIPISHDQEKILEGLPKKAADLVRRFMSRGTGADVLAAAAEGKNAFSETRHRPYRLAMSMILEGGVTRPKLRAQYEGSLGWSRESAKAQATLTWRVFVALGIAEEHGATLVCVATQKE